MNNARDFVLHDCVMDLINAQKAKSLERQHDSTKMCVFEMISRKKCIYYSRKNTVVGLQKSTTRGIPRRSPIQVLTPPDAA